MVTLKKRREQAMSILGIVAEYDPFHLGHERHIREARRLIRPAETLIVLSGCFRQRGDPAMFLPHDRAFCALSAGADAVFALPALYTIRSAEDYAFQAVSLLHSLGCTHISFGAETDNLSLLKEAAFFLEYPPEGFRAALHEAMMNGTGYPGALEKALSAAPGAGEAMFSAGTARLLSRPNNTLAICYLRALYRLHSPMIPVAIRREGQYLSDDINPSSPSASALRSALSRGAWNSALQALPFCSRSLVRRAFLTRRVLRTEPFDSLLLSRLRNMSTEDAESLPDLSEGLENRLLREAKNAFSRGELLSRAASRRYSAARISRLCACALLHIRSQDYSAAAAGPSETLLLALRPRAGMTSRWQDLPVSILSSLKDTKNPILWQADLRAWKIFAQCAGLPDTLPFSERVRVIKEEL